MENKQKIKDYFSTKVSDIFSKISKGDRLKVETKMEISGRIDDLMKEKGWNKVYFAKSLNKSPSEITKWLSGSQNFTVDTLADISIVFNVPIVELIEKKRQEITVNITLTSPRSSISRNSFGITTPLALEDKGNVGVFSFALHDPANLKAKLFNDNLIAK